MQKSSDIALKVMDSMRCLDKFYFQPFIVLLCGLVLWVDLGPAAEVAPNPDTLPMYGQPKIPRSEAQKSADEGFVRDNTLRFRNRAAGSVAFAAQGWTALRAKQVDVAMQRFNQAWLMNPKYYGAFWGFGAALSERGRLIEAIEQLETARTLIDEPAQRPALLADLGALHSEYAVRLPADKQLDRAQHFVLANSRFTESVDNDPNFASAWREWAMSLYDQERYSEAWVKAKRVQELGGEPLPAEFLKKLSAKLPEPKSPDK
jgi:tetratricopeptide (TPR) repeat protein